MFTDVHFTNLAQTTNAARLAFFQKNIALGIPFGKVFKVIQKCQYGWSYTIRIPWDLSFRLVKPSGNTTTIYPLKETYSLEKKKFLLSKDGTISVSQDYGNGKQIIDFEQMKGSTFSSVQIYRGGFLIGEQYFREKAAQFQMDTNISIIENYILNEGEIMALEKTHSATLDFDFVGMKTIHLSLKGDKTLNKLIVQKVEQW